MTGAPTNPLGMSDEDFLKQSHPPEAGGAASEDNSSQADQNSDQQAQIQDNQNQGASQDGDNQGTQSDADEGDSDTKVETAAENTSEDGSKAGTDANADGTTEQENAEAQAQASEVQKKELMIKLIKLKNPAIMNRRILKLCMGKSWLRSRRTEKRLN